MTTLERLQKALSDHEKYRQNLIDQIDRDKLQIAQNEDTLEQLRVTEAALQLQIDTLTAQQNPAPVPSQG